MQTTTQFHTPSTWHLNWHYDCSSFGNSGNFIVDVKNADGSTDFTASAVNQLGAGGDGTQHYFGDDGTHYLDVNSECAWTVTALPGSG